MAMNFWNWDKKPRSTPGRIKRGDIFCFEYDKNTYCFGRIVENKPKEHCILEFLDYISNKPEIDEETVLEAVRMLPLIDVNCDHVFNMKLFGIDVRIIGHQDDFFASDYNDIAFARFMPHSGGIFKEDLHGNITQLSEGERIKSPVYFKSSDRIKKDLSELISQKKFASVISSNNYPTDTEEMIQLLDTLFDARKFNEVIDAVSSFAEDKRNRRIINLLIASYNNTGHYDEALKDLEKFKELYKGRMSIWYYYVTYAQIGKEEYDKALKSIEAGFEECEHEKEVGTVEIKDYYRDIGDFKNLKYRCNRKLEEKEKYKRIGNFVIEKEALVRYEDDKKTTDIVIPDGIKTIEAGAFEKCETLKSVVFPEGLKEMYSGAFKGCTNLESIKFPSTLSYVLQNNHCLEDTKWFKNHPKGQIVTGKYLYLYTGEEETVVIEDGVEIIGSNAFLNNKKIRKVVIPANVRKIYATAFSNCSNLKDVEIFEGLEHISSYAFENCTGLREITLPASVKKLSNGVFTGCENLISVTLPDTLKVLDGEIFCGCKSLEFIHLPAEAEGVTDGYIGWNHQIGGALFQDCEKLREVTFPKGIKKVLEETFAGCTSIQKIVVENPSMMFGKDTFGKKAKYPEALYETSPELPLHLSDGDIKQYIDLDKLSDDMKAKLYIKRQSKSLDPFWEKSVNKGNAKAIGEKINELKATKLSAKEKKNADMFFEKFGGLI